MFKNNNSKQKESKKEVIKMKNILICMVFVVAAFCATSAWARVTSVPITVKAEIPKMTEGLSVGISKVTGEAENGTGGEWTTLPAGSPLDFGILKWTTTNNINIFLPTCYFAVDIGVQDNSGSTWTIIHEFTSLNNSSGGNIDDKVNVTFANQADKTHGTTLLYTSFLGSGNISYTKEALGKGWLRIYYGIGTGNLTKPDASGVTPIGMDTPYGQYSGSVKITLVP
ncbi:MAG: hypothetical protein NTX01_08565 [Candidatus Omnitrophica bacterium]|nr:hypothetical protein [Candidatus Omnitrophota bacterium]